MHIPQQDRLDRCAALRHRKIDALQVSQPDKTAAISAAIPHRTTAFQETAGFLLIPASGKPVLLTDSRFTLQAEAEAPLSRWVTYTGGAQVPGQAVPETDLKILAFESEYFLHASYLRLEKMAARLGLELRAESDLVERMRAVKDAHELG
jgi:Xaa-Pro aminopeptidase